MPIENDIYNEGVMSPIRTSAPNMNINSNSLKSIDLIRKLLNTLKKKQVKF
jgi:hypothetical protein